MSTAELANERVRELRADARAAGHGRGIGSRPGRMRRTARQMRGRRATVA